MYPTTGGAGEQSFSVFGKLSWVLAVSLAFQDLLRNVPDKCTRKGRQELLLEVFLFSKERIIDVCTYIYIYVHCNVDMTLLFLFLKVLFSAINCKKKILILAFTACTLRAYIIIICSASCRVHMELRMEVLKLVCNSCH